MEYIKTASLEIYETGEIKNLRDLIYIWEKVVKMKNIKRYYILNAEPKEVYNALTNKTMLEIWTGEPAEMEPVSGSNFSLWGGSISGVNLEFEENKKIVQQWFFDEENEDSIVTMKLHPNKKGTSLELSHTNIPEDAYENISEGWDEDYFGALNELYI